MSKLGQSNINKQDYKA